MSTEHTNAPRREQPPRSIAAAPVRVSFEAMQFALDRGWARHLSRSVLEFVSYQRCWWVAQQSGWFMVTEPAFVSMLEREAARGPSTREADDSDDDLWSHERTARFLGVSEQGLYSWAAKPDGPPSIKVGKFRRYDPRALRLWLRDQPHGGADA